MAEIWSSKALTPRDMICQVSCLQRGGAMPTIKELREEKGLTQMELCQRAMVSISALSRMENGKPVNRLTFSRVCRALGVRMADVSGVDVIKRSKSA